MVRCSLLRFLGLRGLVFAGGCSVRRRCLEPCPEHCDEELFLLSGLLRNLRLRSEIGDTGVGCVYSVLR